MRFLPDRAMLATGLANGRGIYHQLAQPLVPRPGQIVQIQKSVMDVIPYLVHIPCKDTDFWAEFFKIV